MLIDRSDRHKSAAGRYPPILPASHHLFARHPFIDRTILRKMHSMLLVLRFVTYVNLQKAYDTVQHDIVRSQLQSAGFVPQMLTTIQSVYSSSTLCSKV